MIVIPIVLCKNEEIWIERVLTPLIRVFGNAIVADTGSTDSTREQIAKVPGVTLMTYDNLSPEEVGQCRGWMQAKARELFGATHAMLVDADELYPTKYLQFIHDHPMPENAMSGFTYGIECTELPNGECWMLGTEHGLTGVSRQAVFSVESKWRGTYPFESPDTFVAGYPTNYYWQSLDPSHHFYHLHQMHRSSRDEDVHLRKQKQYQFSMQEHPEIKPHTLWLKSGEDYQDDGR